MNEFYAILCLATHKDYLLAAFTIDFILNSKKSDD